MQRYTRPVVFGIALVIVVVLSMPGRLSGQAEPYPPTLLPPVQARAGLDTPAYPGCGGVFAPVVNADYEQEVVDLVNSVRASNGLPPLKRVDLLDEAARYHATDMAQDDYFKHDSYDRVGGSLVLVCGWSERVGTYYPNWSSLAENIAGGYGTPAAVMDGWMNSSGHRANILSTGNWEIGAGYYAGSGEYYSYWVQDFGRRRDVYPLIINHDAASTVSPDVTLYIYGDWEEMRLRNDEGAWTAWQAFQPTVSWTLGSGQGDRAVWAELRAGSTTTTTGDTIYLEGAAPAAPTLDPIANADLDGDYLVQWSTVAGASGYTLQEDDGAAFASPAVRYSGPGAEYRVRAQPVGTWYYRVSATNEAGTGSWSQVQAATVSASVELDRVYLPLAQRNHFVDR